MEIIEIKRIKLFKKIIFFLWFGYYIFYEILTNYVRISFFWSNNTIYYFLVDNHYVYLIINILYFWNFFLLSYYSKIRIKYLYSAYIFWTILFLYIFIGFSNMSFKG